MRVFLSSFVTEQLELSMGKNKMPDELVELIERLAKDNLDNLQTSLKNDKAIVKLIQEVINNITILQKNKRDVANLFQAITDIIMGLEIRVRNLENRLNDADPKQ
jgi:hypothetical protein